MKLMIAALAALACTASAAFAQDKTPEGCRRRCGDTPLFVGALFDNLRDWRAFDVLVILPNSQKASFDRTGFPAR